MRVPQVQRVVGREITAIESLGKNLLIRFDNGLELRTHLRMNGSWHRYRPGERWRRPVARARLVLEVPGSVAVCFDAPVVELLEQRAEATHAPLGGLGPDLLSPDFDADEAIRRLRDPSRAAMSIGEALLDQRALAGIGNVYRSEVLWIDRVSPFATVGELDDEAVARLVATGAAAAGRQRGRSHATPRARTDHDHRRPRSARATVRLSADGSSVSPVRDADRQCPAWPRPAALGVLVPGLPGSQAMSEIDVRCEPVEGRWRCRVQVADATGSSTHEVEVRDPARFLPAGPAQPETADVERLVRETFAFLLEREPRSSILPTFDLDVVGRYFPDYPTVIRTRLVRVTARQSKSPSGQWAVTTKFGTSTISLIRRSIATLHSRYDRRGSRPCSRPSQSIIRRTASRAATMRSGPTPSWRSAGRCGAPRSDRPRPGTPAP